jgi:hypothetical protein
VDADDAIPIENRIAEEADDAYGPGNWCPDEDKDVSPWPCAVSFKDAGDYIYATE